MNLGSSEAAKTMLDTLWGETVSEVANASSPIFPQASAVFLRLYRKHFWQRAPFSGASSSSAATSRSHSA